VCTWNKYGGSSLNWEITAGTTKEYMNSVNHIRISYNIYNIWPDLGKPTLWVHWSVW